MAAILLPATQGPQGARALIETAMRGGVSVYAVESGVPGNWFAVPQDDERTYLALSLAPGSADIVVSPGDDTNGIGFPLTATQPRIEFAGKAVECLVKGMWKFTTDPAGAVHVVLQRGSC